MGYLYKLVDKTTLEMAQHGKLSLSRPIFEFKGSEGNIIHFAKKINNRLCKNKSIEPTINDINEIKQWIEDYKSTQKETYSLQIDDFDLISDSRILFYIVMSAYCGYFTKTNLDDLTTRSRFIQENDGLKNKIGYIRIEESCIPGQSRWRSAPKEFRYVRYDGDYNDVNNLNGFLHRFDVEYMENDSYAHLKIFNGQQLRRVHYLFTLLDKKFAKQNETRLIFLPQSLEENLSTVAAPIQEGDSGFDSLEERIFYIAVKTIEYCQKTCPKYIYLQLASQEIQMEKL